MTIEELEKLTDGSASMAFGFHDIYRTLESYVNEPGCHALAIRDYYPFWKHHNERSHAGKLLLQDSTNDSVLHIFLDDNIGGSPLLCLPCRISSAMLCHPSSPNLLVLPGYDTAHIVDAREVQTGAPKEFHEVNNKSLLKVEPLNAILDNKYFIRTVEAAVRRSGCCSTPARQTSWSNFRLKSYGSA